MTGKVISNKMAKTVVVLVEELVAHPVYKKRIKQSRKVHAHDELEAGVGDVVEISQTAPISRTKFWRVNQIVKRHAAT